MADQKYTGLTQKPPTGSDIFAVSQSASSVAVTVSSAVAVSTADQGVLFNNQGQVSSNANLIYQYSTQVFRLAGTSSQLWLTHNPVYPGSSAASTVSLYGKQIAGRMMPKVVGPYGVDYALQPSFFQQSVHIIYPTSSAVEAINSGFTFAGTASSAQATVGNAYTTKKRMTFRTSTALANLNAGVTGADNQFFLSSTAGYGGFFFFSRFGMDTYATSTRYFIGLTATASSAICTSDPTGMSNSCGFSLNDASTSWVFMHSSSGVATTEALLGQPALASGQGYDCYIFSNPNSGRLYYRMDDLNNSSTLVNSSVANYLPNSTTFMKCVSMCGGANASSGAARIGFIRMYVETDI